MSVKLLAEHHLEETAQACLHLSKCHIVGNHMSWRKFFYTWKNLDTSNGVARTLKKLHISMETTGMSSDYHQLHLLSK